MTDQSHLLDDLEIDSRETERTRGIYLMLPAFFLGILPMFYFVAMSVYHGRDEFGPLRDFLNAYHIAIFVVMIPCLGALMVSLYLIVIKDFIEPFRRHKHY